MPKLRDQPKKRTQPGFVDTIDYLFDDFTSPEQTAKRTQRSIKHTDQHRSASDGNLENYKSLDNSYSDQENSDYDGNKDQDESASDRERLQHKIPLAHRRARMQQVIRRDMEYNE